MLVEQLDCHKRTNVARTGSFCPLSCCDFCWVFFAATSFKQEHRPTTALIGLAFSPVTIFFSNARLYICIGSSANKCRSPPFPFRFVFVGSGTSAVAPDTSGLREWRQREWAVVDDPAGAGVLGIRDPPVFAFGTVLRRRHAGTLRAPGVCEFRKLFTLVIPTNYEYDNINVCG